MARTPRLASDRAARLPERHDRAIIPAASAAVVLGLAAIWLTARSVELTPAAFALASVAVVVVMIACPARIAAGLALALATAVCFTWAPVNAPGRTIVGGVVLASVALGLGLLRSQRRTSEQVGASDSNELRRTALIGVSIYLGTFLISTALHAGLGASSVALAAQSVPAVLTLVIARRCTGEDLRCFGRVFVGFALFQVAVIIVDLFVRAVPFLGYSFLGYTAATGQRSVNQLLPVSLARAQGLAGHPIVCAMILIVAAVLVLTGALRIRRSRQIPIVAVLVLGIVLCGARSAVLAVLVSVLVLVVLNARTVGARLRNGLLLGIATVCLAMSNTAIGFGLSFIGELSQSGSYLHRAAAWTSLPAVFGPRSTLDRLIGTGYGTEARLFQSGFLQQDNLAVVDNQFVTSLVVTGVIGTAAIALILVRAVIVGATMVRCTALIVLVMFNSFDLLRWAGPALLFFVVVALADRAKFRHGHHPAAADRRSAPPRHALALTGSSR